MSMRQLEEALRLVFQNPEQAGFTGPESEERLREAEDLLGTSFPPTYRRFLKELGCADIGSYEIFGLVPGDLMQPGPPNAVWLTLAERRDAALPDGLLPVYSVGDGTYYALDTSHHSTRVDAPVVAWTPGEGIELESLPRVAEDFGSLFLELVERALQDG